MYSLDDFLRVFRLIVVYLEHVLIYFNVLSYICLYLSLPTICCMQTPFLYILYFMNGEMLTIETKEVLKAETLRPSSRRCFNPLSATGPLLSAQTIFLKFWIEDLMDEGGLYRVFVLSFIGGLPIEPCACQIRLEL